MANENDWLAPAGTLAGVTATAKHLPADEPQVLEDVDPASATAGATSAAATSTPATSPPADALARTEPDFRMRDPPLVKLDEPGASRQVVSLRYLPVCTM